MLGSFVAAGCGGGATFANKPRPPTPVNLTRLRQQRPGVDLTDLGRRRPGHLPRHQRRRQDRVGDDSAADGGQTLGTTGPINPQSTAQVTVDFRTPGEYTVATDKGGQDRSRPVHEVADPTRRSSTSAASGRARLTSCCSRRAASYERSLQDRRRRRVPAPIRTACACANRTCVQYLRACKQLRREAQAAAKDIRPAWRRTSTRWSCTCTRTATRTCSRPSGRSS